MEYPENKKNPLLLLKLATLYIEFAAYRGALSVCTLLIEGYTHFKHINEAIFLSAVTAKALGKHKESAQYFQYLVEKPPHRINGYHLHLLAARELEKVSGMQELVRESYSQAYKAMIAMSPITASEKAAHEIYNSSRKNKNLRMQHWYQDDSTWFDLAKKMVQLNFPLLALSALEVVRQRHGNLLVDMLVLEGVCLHRIGDPIAAVGSLAQAIHVDYHSKLVQFLLQNWSEDWRLQFALENESARKIQQITRRYFNRTKWRAVAALLVEANRNYKACIIQCAWRKYVAVCALAVLKKECQERENAENVVMATHDEITIMKRLNAATMKIQTLHKIFLAKRERRIRQALCDRHTTILTNFSTYRAAAGRKFILKAWKLFVQIQETERENAAVVMQRRKLYARLLQKKHSQDKIIELCLSKKSASVKTLVLEGWKDFTKLLQREKQQGFSAFFAHMLRVVDTKLRYEGTRSRLKQ
uniref:Uncharacterized protein n=1 Tax=Globisporangium ultimum (strain ATCC 200006 / CBS 805.95 / DAOM BR144) TaxID=431595 RepID=K3X3Z7_GLOUD